MIAYYIIDLFNSLIIDEIIYDVEDRVVFHLQNSITDEKKGRKRRAIIRSDRNGAPYFIHNRKRIYLDECIKMHIPS